MLMNQIALSFKHCGLQVVIDCKGFFFFIQVLKRVYSFYIYFSLSY